MKIIKNTIEKIKNRKKIFSSMEDFDDKKQNIKSVRNNLIMTYVVVFFMLSKKLVLTMSPEAWLILPIIAWSALVLLSISTSITLWPLHLKYKYSYVLKYTSTVVLITTIASLPYAFTRDNPDQSYLNISYMLFATLISLFIYRVSYYQTKRKQLPSTGDASNDDEYGFVEDMDSDYNFVINKKKLALSIADNILKIAIIIVLGYMSMAVGLSVTL